MLNVTSERNFGNEFKRKSRRDSRQFTLFFPRRWNFGGGDKYQHIQIRPPAHEPLKQRTYHSDDFVLAPVVGMTAH
jgi:hypothetical protein